MNITSISHSSHLQHKDYMTNKIPHNKNKGFTLIEVLVAIFVLITAVVVPLTIGSKAFAYSNFVRDQSTASYLAQEAMEYVRLLRDNASLNPSPNEGAWGDFKNSVSNCEGGQNNDNPGCYFAVGTDPSRTNIQLCEESPSNCPAMFLQENGTYSYEQNNRQSFVRTVQTHIENPGSPNLERMRITVTLSWNTNGISDRSFSIVNYLMPWQI